MARPLPDPGTLRNAVAMTGSGERLGPVVDLFLADPAHPDEEPGWAWVRTGIADADVRLVPLAEARYHDGGLVIPFSRNQVDGAPQHPAGPERTDEARQELRRHYATPGTAPVRDPGPSAPQPVPAPVPDVGPGWTAVVEETPVPRPAPSAPPRGSRPEPVRGALPVGHGVTEPFVEKLLRFGRRAVARLHRS